MDRLTRLAILIALVRKHAVQGGGSRRHPQPFSKRAAGLRRRRVRALVRTLKGHPCFNDA
jgi:hypothetical protein